MPYFAGDSANMLLVIIVLMAFMFSVLCCSFCVVDSMAAENLSIMCHAVVTLSLGAEAHPYRVGWGLVGGKGLRLFPSFPSMSVISTPLPPTN